jgi:hypothetical protein
MSRYAILRTIQSLDPEQDHQRIVFLSSCFDFPFDTTRALEFALFRTFCVPNIAALLDRTGEFGHRAQKRYNDTDLLISEMIEWGYESERGRRALRRINQQHGRFAIANDDFLYVLSTFIYEPIRWNSRFGWRPMCDKERLAYFYFWCEVGRRMHINDIPDDYTSFEAFNRSYEKHHYHFTEANRRVGAATREMFVSWFPQAFAPLTRRFIHAMLDDALIEAFGFPPPSPTARRLATGALRLRGKLAAWLPARHTPRLRTEMRHPSYPNGYVIEELGPPVSR